MSIRFYCEACQTRIKVPDGNEGRPVRCPKCSNLQRVPVDTQELSSTGLPEHGDPHDLALLAGVTADSLDIESESHVTGDDVSGSLENSNDPSHIPSTKSERYDEPLEPEDNRSLHPHQGHQIDVDLPIDDDNPLAALAAQAQGGGGDSSITQVASALKDVDEPRDHGSDAVHINEAFPDANDYPDLVRDRNGAQLSDTVYPQQGNVGLATAVTEPEGMNSLSARPATPSSKSPHNETSKRRPVSPSNKIPSPSTASPGRGAQPQPQSGTSSTTSPKRRQRGSSSPPNAVPLSKSKPTATRSETVTAHNATIDLSSRPKRSKPHHNNAHGYIALQIAAWMLRILAVLTIGGAVKLLLIAIDEGRTIVDHILILLVGLICSVVVWTIGEIASVLRDIARRTEP